MKENKTFAISLGLISALFFAVTFVLNRLMSVDGGSWIWSSSFRFFFMLPLMFIIVATRKGLSDLFNLMKKNILAWILWSTIGFGLFYAPLTFSALYAPSWLVASTWQFTIVAGLIMAPFLTDKNIHISKKAFLFSGIILIGIAIMQVKLASSVSVRDILLGVFPVLVAAFAYPLGNRKMMIITNGKLDVYQRILGMLIASMPFWILLSLIGLSTTDLPDKGQLVQTFIVAVSSGVIATSLFFKATDNARNNQKLLASVEATQSGEVLFALIGEITILGGHFPDIYSMIGIAFVILGMLLHSLFE